MREKKVYYVYILASISRVLYTGMTSQLSKRIVQHKEGVYGSTFTRKYNVNRLVYYERYVTADQAILREKQIKKWRREKKIQLIHGVNPKWKDLSLEWID